MPGGLNPDSMHSTVSPSQAIGTVRSKHASLNLLNMYNVVAATAQVDKHAPMPGPKLHFCEPLSNLLSKIYLETLKPQVPKTFAWASFYMHLA